MKKKVAVLFLVLLVAASTCINGVKVSASTTTYSQASDIAQVCALGYNSGVYGPIMMMQATLNVSGTNQSVYMVCMSGTEYVTNQTTWLYTDLLAGFNLSNTYLTNVVSVITENIPEGSNLFLSGHSLGGMIAQQVAANSTIKANYNVLYTVTFGAPLISAGSREGTVRRLGDTSDIVPYLSATGTILEVWQVAGLNREDGGYGTDILSAHLYSYIRSDVWGGYDVAGNKGGSATLSYDLSSITYYQSPSS